MCVCVCVCYYVYVCVCLCVCVCVYNVRRTLYHHQFKLLSYSYTFADTFFHIYTDQYMHTNKEVSIEIS